MIHFEKNYSNIKIFIHLNFVCGAIINSILAPVCFPPILSSLKLDSNSLGSPLQSVCISLKIKWIWHVRLENLGDLPGLLKRVFIYGLYELEENHYP